MKHLITVATMCYVRYLLLLRELQSQCSGIITQARFITFITMVLPPAYVNDSHQCSPTDIMMIRLENYMLKATPLLDKASANLLHDVRLPSVPFVVSADGCSNTAQHYIGSNTQWN